MNQEIKPKDYPFHHKTKTRWKDLDAFQHINNAVFLSYFEDARVGLFKKPKGPKGPKSKFRKGLEQKFKKSKVGKFFRNQKNNIRIHTIDKNCNHFYYKKTIAKNRANKSNHSGQQGWFRKISKIKVFRPQPILRLIPKQIKIC